MKVAQSLFLAVFMFLFFPQIGYAQGNLTINEFSPHPSADNKEWVELYNPDNRDLLAYWIDDDADFLKDEGNSAKKNIAGLLSGSDTLYPLIEVSSLFNNSGDVVALFDNAGTMISHYEYTADPGVDQTIGRSPDGTGDFAMLLSATKGQMNSAILPTMTPTPTITPTPTKEPTPTKIPTSTKTPTATKSSSPSTKNLASTVSQSSKSNIAGGNRSPTINLSGVPTSVLGASTSSVRKASSSDAKEIKKGTLKKHSESNPVFWGLVGVGTVFLLSCGILMFLKIKKKGTL